MKYSSIFLAFIGIISLELIQPAFAHGVHCGPLGCPVGGFGINDLYLAQKAFESMFYLSVVMYGAIMILFWFSLLKGKYISTIVRK